MHFFNTGAGQRPALGQYPAKYGQEQEEKTVSHLIMDELNPGYLQRLLSVGYHEETVRHCLAHYRPGFVATAEPSLELYISALTTHQGSISEGRLEFYHGRLPLLPYPHHFFDGIFGMDPWKSRKERVDSLLHMYWLVRSGGKIVIGFPLRHQNDDAEGFSFDLLKEDLRIAGFHKLQYAYSELESGSWVLATGLKE
jgi:hypothetical protein